MSASFAAATLSCFVPHALGGGVFWSLRDGVACEGTEAPEATSADDCRNRIDIQHGSTWTRSGNVTRCVHFDAFSAKECHENPLSDTWQKFVAPCPAPPPPPSPPAPPSPPSPPPPPPPVLPGSSGYFAVFGAALEAQSTSYLDEKAAMQLQTSEDCHVRCMDIMESCIGFRWNVDHKVCHRLSSVDGDIKFQTNTTVDTYLFHESLVHSYSGPVAYFNQNVNLDVSGDDADMEETSAEGLSERECWQQCLAHDSCSCVTYQASSGKCWRHSSCNPASFENARGYVVYYKYTAMAPQQPKFEPFVL